MVAEKENGIEAASGGGSIDASAGDIAILGQVLRDAHRAFSRALQSRIAAHGVTMGQWSFLRALWEEDGLTQRQLSQRVGMMEPTTVTALNGMERSGFVVRVRNPGDRRKVNIYLTEKGRALQALLLPHALEVARQATEGVSAADLRTALHALSRLIANLDRTAASDFADGFD